MWDVFERTKVDPLVLAVLFGAHVAVVLDDFAQDLRRQQFFLALHESELALICVSFFRKRPPAALFELKLLSCQFSRTHASRRS